MRAEGRMAWHRADACSQNTALWAAVCSPERGEFDREESSAGSRGRRTHP